MSWRRYSEAVQRVQLEVLSRYERRSEGWNMTTRLAAILLTIYIGAYTGVLSIAKAAELVPYVVENANAIPEPLVEGAPDAELGAALMLTAGCSACHQKDLNRISERMTAGEMRLMIVAPEVRVPDTAMPAYYKVGVYGEAPEELVGGTRLSAEEIEAVIAYLKTL